MAICIAQALKYPNSRPPCFLGNKTLFGGGKKKKKKNFSSTEETKKHLLVLRTNSSSWISLTDCISGWEQLGHTGSGAEDLFSMQHGCHPTTLVLVWRASSHPLEV